MGLADGVLGGGENLSMDVHVLNAASGILGGLQPPTRGALLDEYHRRVANGAAPAEGHEAASVSDSKALTGGAPETASNDWLDESFVFIEQQRFKFL